MPVNPKLDLKRSETGDPYQQEKTPPPTEIEAVDRRTIRQAIITQLLIEVAQEVIASHLSLDGSLKKAYDQNGGQPPDKDKFRLLRALITDPEPEFNRVRNQLYVAEQFGSINLVVFRNAMAIGQKDVDVEEVARRVIIRTGQSGYHRKSGVTGFAGCK
jgi:hypothetical protein